jgi:hypothetical protein
MMAYNLELYFALAFGQGCNEACRPRNRVLLNEVQPFIMAWVTTDRRDSHLDFLV